MSTLTIRQVPDQVAEILKERARQHGRSMEAEVRHLLWAWSSEPDETVPRSAPGLGTLIARRFEGLLDDELPLPPRVHEARTPLFPDE
ncbi:MAG: hypothetical protein JWP75_1774 [Frondihabitans sp.]|nr:hypothetical protein [Frondihabitans sp.]